MTRTVAEKRAAFRALHAEGCFVLPNPWDLGSARFLQGLGFKALATTSSGFAWSRGQADGALSRETILAHLREIVAATDLPVNADFESGFAPDPQGVAESVRMAVETGVAGLSIEDSTGDPAHPLHAIDVAVARLRAARGAIDEAGGDTLLVGRAENFFKAGRTSTTRSPGSRPMRRRAPTASTRRASARASRSPPWWLPSHPSRSICSSDRPASSPCRTLPNSACGASASAVRWRERHGVDSCARPARFRKRGVSTASRTPPRATNSMRFSVGASPPAAPASAPFARRSRRGTRPRWFP